MSTIPMSTNARVTDQTKARGDHGSVVAFGFIVLVLICLVAVNSLLGGTVTPQDAGLLVGP